MPHTRANQSDDGSNAGNSNSFTFSLSGVILGKVVRCRCSILSWLLGLMCFLYLFLLVVIIRGKLLLNVDGSLNTTNLIQQIIPSNSETTIPPIIHVQPPPSPPPPPPSLPKQFLRNAPPVTPPLKSEERSNGIMFENFFYPVIPQDPHLIFGMASHIDSKYLAIFIKSLRVTAKSSATVILFINHGPLDFRTAELVQTYRLIMIPVNHKTLAPTFLQNYHPSSTRWVLFHRLFQENQMFLKKYFQLYLSLDIRDSVFQSNPFHLISPPPATPIASSLAPVASTTGSTLYVFAESDSKSIMTCSWNSGWIRDCFGEDGLSKISRQHILCSGVVMSNTFNAMDEYILLMSNTLQGYKLLTTNDEIDPTSRFPKCERNGVDQGVHNYLIHNRLINPRHRVEIYYPLQFPIINLQSMSDQILPIRQIGYDYDVISMPGSAQLYALVHQYDRNFQYQKSLAQKYIHWIRWNDQKNGLISDWSQTLTCTSSFVYEEDVDLFKGKCDYGVSRAMTAAGCCDACKNYKGSNGIGECTAFTYVQGSCFLKKCNMLEIADVLKLFRSQLGVSDTMRGVNEPNLLKIMKRSLPSYMEGAISGYLK